MSLHLGPTVYSRLQWDPKEGALLHEQIIDYRTAGYPHGVPQRDRFVFVCLMR
jgi:hypothetical protein